MKAKVLVCDDDPAVAEIAAILSDAGYEEKKNTTKIRLWMI